MGGRRWNHAVNNEKEQHKNTGEKMDSEQNESFRRVKTVKRTLVLMSSENLGNWERWAEPKTQCMKVGITGSDSFCKEVRPGTKARNPR